ncbi:MAG: bifunctional metallophosphatase/5'-nucleotidase [Oligoflexia bacterium]|nr:bifunctional metallophosphatase/5'-nucleotidase [Oligoflexia bacterium]
MIHPIRFFLWFLVLSLVLGCSSSQKSTDPIRVIKIFHTNDIHSHYMPSRNGRGGLAYLATTLKVIREGDPDAILIDVGDMYKKGSQPAQLSNDETMAEIVSKLPAFNFRVVGNNEVKIGLDNLFSWAKKYEPAPLISANLVDKDGKRPFDPYVVVRRLGVKIGFIGLTHSFEIEAKDQSKGVGAPFRILQAEEVLPKLIKELRPQVDILVLAAHLDHSLNDRLASKFPELDLVLGGHSHILSPEQKLTGKGLVVEAGEYGRQIGVVHLDYDVNKKTVVQSEFSHWAVGPVLNQLADVEIAQLIESHYNKWAPEARKPIAEAMGQLSLINSQNPKEGTLHNWVADIIRKSAKTDFSFINRQMLREEIQKGTVDKENLLMALPYPGELVDVTMKRAQFEAMFDRALQREWAKTTMIGFGVSPGSIRMTGLKQNPRISVFLSGNRDPIKIAMPHYVATHCEEFFEISDCPFPRWRVGPDIRELILNHLKLQPKISPPGLGRVRELND